jgi:deoxyribodipyrimidine photo-lyase
MDLHWGATLIHLDDLPFLVSDCPYSFTSFRKLVEADWKPRAPLPNPQPGQLSPLPPTELLDQAGFVLGFVPNLEHLPPAVHAHDWSVRSPNATQLCARPLPTGVVLFRGGESQALERLRYYMRSPKHLPAHYFDTRNGMLGVDYRWVLHADSMRRGRARPAKGI